MTKEELKQIAEIVAKNQKPMPDMSKMIDWLFKALIAILVWIGSDRDWETISAICFSSSFVIV